MLAFFRKYERTFFLIVFAPAILGMGVTGVIVSVLNREPPHATGKVFGETVPQTEWDTVTGPYRKLMRQQDEGSEAQWRFFAFVKAAERAGVRVPDEKVAEDIVSEMRFEIAQLHASERVRDEGLDINTPEGQQKFRSYVLEAIQNPEFTESDYKKILERYGMSVTEYEGHQKREKMREELFDAIHEAGTVAPEDIWKAFRDKAQTRSALVVTLDAAAYVPSNAAAVTEDEVKRYYEANKDLYEEPRRVDLEYVAAPFEKTRAEIQQPGEAALKDYYEKHQDLYKLPAPAGQDGVAKVDSFEHVKDKVLEAVTDSLAKDRAENLLEQVSSKLDEQRKAGKIDMKAAMESVAAANTNTQALVHGTTGLLEPDQISTHPVLNGFAAYRWANSEPKSDTRTSEPLGGEKCACVLRTADVKERREPSYDEVKARVREDYVNGNEKEIKRFYDASSFKYRTKEQWKVQVLVADYDAFDKDPNIDEPQKADLDSFWNVEGAKLWPGKQRKDVSDDDLKKAWHHAEAKKNAQAAIKAVRDLAKDTYAKDHRADLDLLKNDPKVKKAGFLGSTQVLTLDRDGLAASPILKLAATSVPIAAAKEPSEVYSLPDEKGQVLYVVQEKLDPKLPELATVKADVVKDVLLGRGFERAKDAADKLLVELKDLTGPALDKALAAKGLSAKTTDSFPRTSTVVPGMGVESQRIVSETYTCEVAGGLQRALPDKPNDKVYLVGCAARKDPPDSALAADIQAIRHDLLREKKDEFAKNFIVELELKAKGVTPESGILKWVRARRDGPSGQVSSKIRQIFVPDDRTTLDAWLDDAARKRLAEAQAKLKSNVPWQAVVFEFTDDQSTRGTEGSLIDVARGDLVDQYGAEFEDKVFSLPNDGIVSQPIKSKKGWHLVLVTKPATTVAGGDRRRGPEVRMSFKHLLVKTDPVLRQMPEDVAKKAREIARGKIEKAKARLAAGEPFGHVGAELGASDDERAKGEPFTIEYASPEVLMALRQPVDPSDLEKQLVPEPLTVGNATEWHLMFCTRDPNDKESSYKGGPRTPRLVFETVGASQEAVLEAKKDILGWIKDRTAEGKDPSSQDILREWKHVCERHSTAPTHLKQGAFGEVSMEKSLRSIEDSVFEKIFATPAGQRSDVIEAKDGFRIVEVISVETKPEGDAVRDREVGEAILHGTDWAEDR